MVLNSVIVPCWLMDEEIKDICAKSLESFYRIPDKELIIIDNGSSVGSDMLQDYADIYIRNKENLGFSKAVNQGLKMATGENLLILNDDLLLYDGWYDEIEKALNNNIIVPEIGTAYFWVMNRSVFEMVGLLDESFGPAGWSDDDYWKRASKYNIKRRVAAKHLCFHYDSVTTKKLPNYKDLHEEGRRRFNKKYG